jgi:predicted nucleotidyltransferase
MSAKIRKILKKFKREIVAIYGERLHSIILFGSRARGDARDDSDIDLLIVLKGDFDYIEMLKRSDDIAAALSLENDIVISRAFTSDKEFKERQTPFLMNVRREGIPV